MNEKIVIFIPAEEQTQPDEKHPLRVAAYCRVSNPNDEQASSLETQKQYYFYKNNHPAIISAETFEKVQ